MSKQRETWVCNFAVDNNIRTVGGDIVCTVARSEHEHARGVLIAAATDMAEALRVARDCLSDPHPSTAQRVDSINAINAALERAGLGEQ